MAAPLPLRIGLVALGMSLVAGATRLALARDRSSASAGHPHADRVLGAIVWCLVRVSHRTGLARRRIDPDILATRLALAPRTWPARAGTAVAARNPDIVELADIAAGVRLSTAVAAGVVGAGAGLPISPAAAILAAAGAAVAGSFLPDLVLSRASRAARRADRRSASRTVDVLAAAVSAGLPLGDALKLTAGHAPPTLAAACRGAAIRLRIGGDPLAALVAEADQFGLPILADVGEAVDRQRRLGTSLGAELRHIAARARAEERAHVLSHAARRGPLGTLIVALVIAPVCLAALTACLVGGLVDGGSLGLR